ncbi:maleylpyruvate isomerase N-terminal domain-containing protein [Prauserella marina]|nr:maleylpyruvate isomerase N-terminal domain-containing protein [Prauserella marina]
MDDAAASTPDTRAHWLGPRVDVLPLFARQHDAFVGLLREFTAEDWTRPTVCPGWTVHDVVAHVLADHVGRLCRSCTEPVPQPLREPVGSLQRDAVSAPTDDLQFTAR